MVDRNKDVATTGAWRVRAYRAGARRGARGARPSAAARRRGPAVLGAPPPRPLAADAARRLTLPLPRHSMPAGGAVYYNLAKSSKSHFETEHPKVWCWGLLATSSRTKQIKEHTRRRRPAGPNETVSQPTRSVELWSECGGTWLCPVQRACMYTDARRRQDSELRLACAVSLRPRPSPRAPTRPRPAQPPLLAPHHIAACDVQVTELEPGSSTDRPGPEWHHGHKQKAFAVTEGVPYTECGQAARGGGAMR
uniref:SFRICE_009113 n=1 Tax=Spodoptera frugiperda TaxID=7108 RepID=A0A2H1WBF2_SPOFR